MHAATAPVGHYRHYAHLMPCTVARAAPHTCAACVVPKTPQSPHAVLPSPVLLAPNHAGVCFPTLHSPGIQYNLTLSVVLLCHSYVCIWQTAGTTAGRILTYLWPQHEQYTAALPPCHNGRRPRPCCQALCCRPWQPDHYAATLFIAVQARADTCGGQQPSGAYMQLWQLAGGPVSRSDAWRGKVGLGRDLAASQPSPHHHKGQPLRDNLPGVVRGCSGCRDPSERTMAAGAAVRTSGQRPCNSHCRSHQCFQLNGTSRMQLASMKLLRYMPSAHALQLTAAVAGSVGHCNTPTSTADGEEAGWVVRDATTSLRLGSAHAHTTPQRWPPPPPGPPPRPCRDQTAA
jgi:hypothetical protein